MELIDKALFAKNLLLSRFLKPKPLVVHINITNKCNLHCQHCYGSYPTKQMETDLPTEKWLDLVDELAKYGTKRIDVAGGEPLLRKDIGEILSRMKKRHMIVSMNTNGHFVKNNIDVIRKLNTLCISLDGDEEAHDKIKGEGSFKKAMEAIRIAKENKVVVHTNTVITKNSIQAVQTILEAAKKYGFMAYFSLPFFHRAQIILPSSENIRAVLNKLIKYKKKGYPVSLSYDSLRYMANWPDYEKNYNTEIGKIKFKKENGQKIIVRLPCQAGKFTCVIDYNGLVYPCGQLTGNPIFSPLNFWEVGFKKAFENTLNHKCKSCYSCSAFNDYNILLNGSFRTLLNYVRNSFIEQKFKKLPCKKTFL